jgi:hypothetical protein
MRWEARLAMRFRVTFKWFAIAASVLCGMGSATAQQQQQQQQTGAGANGQVGFERRPQLSPQEEMAQSDSILRRIDSAAGTVRRQLENARAARDVVKTLCLNDKLSQIDVANRSARDRQSALQSAAERSDAELANHEFTILTVLRQRVEQLTAEANQCIGEEMTWLGQTEVSTQIDPNLPGVDTTAYPPSDFSTIPAGSPECMTCTGLGP